MGDQNQRVFRAKIAGRELLLKAQDCPAEANLHRPRRVLLRADRPARIGTTGAFHLAFLSSTTFTSSQKPGDTSLGCCDTTRLRQSSGFSRKATASADAAMTGD